MTEPSYETLIESFKCLICTEKLKQAHLCPHCSKPCCYDCIRQWLTEQRPQCPHCRSTLYVQDLIHCRWIEDITEQLEILHQAEEKAKKEFCLSHNERLSVFCLTCEQCICLQCSLWDRTHSNHVFKPIEEIYSERLPKIKSELICLQKRRSDINGLLKGLTESIADLKKFKSRNVKEAAVFLRNTFSCINEKMVPKLTALESHKDLLSKECKEVESIINFAEEQMKASSTELLSSSKSILLSISKVKWKPLKYFEYELEELDPGFLSEITPKYDRSSFKIPNFKTLQMSGDPVYSPPLQATGLTWRLKVYPAGKIDLNAVKYLAVYFELISGFDITSKYQCQLRILHKSGDFSKAIEKRFISEFAVGESRGFHNFYPLTLLASNGFLNPNDDMLSMDFGVRAVSYYRKSRDQGLYIKKLLIAQDQYIKEINDLKEQLTASSRGRSCKKVKHC